MNLRRQGWQPWSILTFYGPCFCICQLAWYVFRRPMIFYTAWGLDATFLTYASSITVWITLGIMTSTFVKSALAEAGIELSGIMSANVTQQAVSTLVVFLGVGAQPILTNFTSGLLLVLFRPFHVGDDVQVGDELFTVKAITAFFVTGTTFNHVHVSLPNSSVLASARPLTNYTANTNLHIELAVHVHAGQVPCAVVRAAMDEAASAFRSMLPALLVKCGVEDAKAVAAALPPPLVLGPCALTADGVKWMLKPLVPELAWLHAIDLGNACIHDALMEADIPIFDGSDRRAMGEAAERASQPSFSR